MAGSKMQLKATASPPPVDANIALEITLAVIEKATEMTAKKALEIYEEVWIGLDNLAHPAR